MDMKPPKVFGRTYSFIRSRQLEGTLSGDRALGVWGTTMLRVWRGWGAVSEEEWPYDSILQQWPPSEPPNLDERAKRNRLIDYGRIHNSLEAKHAIASELPVMASFEITAQWFNAEKGIIEMPETTETIIGSHAVLLTGYSDEEGRFGFVNSWGERWGENGVGGLPYEYFDRWMLEAYTADLRPILFPATGSASIWETQWAVQDFLGRPFLAYEIFDTRSDERMAWAFAMPHEDLIEVQELFVRPQYRCRGYGTRLLRSLQGLSETTHLPLHLFVSFPDCEEINLKRIERLFAREGYFLTSSGVRWAPYTALRKAESVRIPPPPGLVYQGDISLGATMPFFGEANSVMVPAPINSGAAGDEHESRFLQLTPGEHLLENTSNLPWLVVLSKWSQQFHQELIDRIGAIFLGSATQGLEPTVLIVDDIGDLGAGREDWLDELTDAGGIVLSQNPEDEFATIQRDPIGFATKQLVAMQAQSVTLTAPAASGPSSPDAYKEFARAVTRLSPDALREVIEGHRTDDWRYTI